MYEGIGLFEDDRSQLVDILAQLRANGNEFDVEHSNEVIEEVGSRGPDTRTRPDRLEIV